MHLAASQPGRTCAFLPRSWKVTANIDSFFRSRINYTVSVGVCALAAFKALVQESAGKASFPPDANGPLLRAPPRTRKKTRKNEIKLQNSNQLISARFISVPSFCFAYSLRPYWTHIFAERHRVRNILHLGLRRMYPPYMCRFYYMPIRHICNVRFNFFVFNLSPWPFLEGLGESDDVGKFFCLPSPYIWR